MGINVLSCFDGMSCGRIALERAGIEVDNYFSSEIDPYAIKIANKNYPQDEGNRLGNILEVKASDLPKIDLLIGGSPCQGFSFAGKQLNFEDERSKLFFEYVRLLKECKPKYFLLENVKMKKEYEQVISDLLGVEPILINSSVVSAGSRPRLYWTNIPYTEINKKEISLNNILIDGYSNRDKSHCIDANYSRGTNLRRYLYRGSRQVIFTDKEFMKKLFDNKPSIEECNTIGNENKDKWRKLLAIECERVQTVPDNYTEGVPDFWRYHMLGNGWTVDVIAHIFKGLK